MPSRRAFSVAMVGGLAASAGCTSKIFSQEVAEQPREVYVVNPSDTAQQIRVRILSEDGGNIFEHSYDLSPGEGDETREFSGNPGKLIIDFRDGGSEAFDYSPEITCKNYPVSLLIGITGENEAQVDYDCRGDP